MTDNIKMTFGNTYYIFCDKEKLDRRKCIYCYDISVVGYPESLITFYPKYYIIKNEEQKCPTEETQEIYDCVIKNVSFYNPEYKKDDDGTKIYKNCKLFICIDDSSIIITHNDFVNSIMEYYNETIDKYYYIEYKNDNLILLENTFAFEVILKDYIQKYQNNECIDEYLTISLKPNDELEKLKSKISSHGLNVIYTEDCTYVFQEDTYKYLISFYQLCLEVPKIKTDFYLFRG